MRAKIRFWTLREVNRLRELHGMGFTQREMATLLGRSLGSVSEHVARLIGGKRPFSEAQRVEQVRALAAKGLTARAIGRRIGLSESRVWALAKKAGVGLASRGWRLSHEGRQACGMASCVRSREQAARLGWPEVTKPSPARILEALLAGPAGAVEIAGRAGRDGGNKNVLRILYDHLTDLHLLGLIEPAGEVVAPSGRRVAAWRLTPWLEGKKRLEREEGAA